MNLLKNTVNKMKFTRYDKPKEVDDIQELELPSIYIGTSIDNHSALIRCPSYCDSKTKYNLKKLHTEKRPISDVFVTALQSSNQRVWLLDSYLHKASENNPLIKLESLLNFLEYGDRNIRLYLKSDKNVTNIKELIDEYNRQYLKKDKTNSSLIEYKFFNLDFIHDRFAIVDNILWHFGSDIGASNASLNTTSYGWNANKNGVISFFEELWDKGKNK